MKLKKNKLQLYDNIVNLKKLLFWLKYNCLTNQRLNTDNDENFIIYSIKSIQT